MLHHHSAGLDAPRLVREAARVLRPGGWLFSIEPLWSGFDLNQWQMLLAQPEVAIAVREVNEFYQMPTSRSELERYTLVIGQKPDLPC